MSCISCYSKKRIKRKIKKIKFTPEEDEKLLMAVEKYGVKDWNKISSEMGTRNSRQCRERWQNYVNPLLRNDPYTVEEDILLETKFFEYGSKWNKIAKFFKNRSSNSLRNRWTIITRRKYYPNMIGRPYDHSLDEVKTIGLYYPNYVISNVIYYTIPIDYYSNTQNLNNNLDG